MEPRYFDIRDYGAVSGGEVLCTRAFEQAIIAAAACGGTVKVPEGIFLTGAIFLKSNMKLYIEKGGVILGTNEESQYPIVESRVAGIEMSWPAALVNIRDAENVTVYGEGIIDGQGEFWWKKYWGEDGKGGMRADYEKRGLRWAIDYDCFRVRNIVVFRCSNVVIEGLTCRRPGFWNVHLCYSRAVLVDGLTIKDGLGPSTDGIDIDSCSDVTVEHCTISCNDDCICLKSGRDADGLRVNRVCENVTIRNNTILEGAGITLGSETSGGIRGVLIADNVFKRTKNGFRLKSAKTRGGLLEDVQVDNLVMEDVKTPFSFEFNWNPSYSYCEIPEGYEGEVPEYWYRMVQRVPAERGIPHAKNIRIRNVKSTVTENCPWAEEAEAFHISGLKEAPFGHISFENVEIQARRFGDIQNIAALKLCNVSVDIREENEERKI